MSDNKSNGIGTVGAVQVVFLINKLTDAGEIAAWSWWWVLAPIWISLVLALLIGAINGVVEAVQEAKLKKARSLWGRRL